MPQIPLDGNHLRIRLFFAFHIPILNAFDFRPNRLFDVRPSGRQVVQKLPSCFNFLRCICECIHLADFQTITHHLTLANANSQNATPRTSRASFSCQSVNDHALWRCDALHRLRLDAAAAYPQSLSRLGLGGQIGFNSGVDGLRLSRIVQGLGPKQPESYNED